MADIFEQNRNYVLGERFKEALAETTSASGKPLSVSTKSTHMRHVRQFFRWLADKPGYKSRIGWSDANYHRLSRTEERVASEHRDPVYPLPEHALKSFRVMPADSELQRRDKAMFAFFMMTGARVKATSTLKLKRIASRKCGAMHERPQCETCNAARDRLVERSLGPCKSALASPNRRSALHRRMTALSPKRIMLRYPQMTALH